MNRSVKLRSMERPAKGFTALQTLFAMPALAPCLVLLRLAAAALAHHQTKATCRPIPDDELCSHCLLSAPLALLRTMLVFLPDGEEVSLRKFLAAETGFNTPGIETAAVALARAAEMLDEMGQSCEGGLPSTFLEGIEYAVSMARDDAESTMNGNPTTRLIGTFDTISGLLAARS